MHVSHGETVFIKSGYVHKTSYETENNSERILVSFSSEFVYHPYDDMLNDIAKKKALYK